MAQKQKTRENIQALDPQTIIDRVQKLRRERVLHRISRKTGELKNPMLLRTTRKEIARLLTVLSQKRREDGSR